MCYDYYEDFAIEAEAQLEANVADAEAMMSTFEEDAVMYLPPSRRTGSLDKRVKVKYLNLLRNRPDREKAFLVEIKEGVECWAPYSECNLFEDIEEFDCPQWLYKRMKDAGEV